MSDIDDYIIGLELDYMDACRTSALGSQITRSSSVLSVTEELFANCQ